MQQKMEMQKSTMTAGADGEQQSCAVKVFVEMCRAAVAVDGPSQRRRLQVGSRMERQRQEEKQIGGSTYWAVDVDDDDVRYGVLQSHGYVAGMGKRSKSVVGPGCDASLGRFGHWGLEIGPASISRSPTPITRRMLELELRFPSCPPCVRLDWTPSTWPANLSKATIWMCPPTGPNSIPGSSLLATRDRGNGYFLRLNFSLAATSSL
ncbi:uncharacterized protein IWZ02DRAFT_508496 [Phyllosticta citriasiana]|uniref:uncharacterized protein n=1 Tax=Phyllosticta citriasiana TaxID=595635 RepID=UPI0030FD2797